MKKLRQFLCRHKPRIKWYWQSYKGWNPSRSKNIMGVVTCTKCGKEFGGPNVPPR